MTEMEKISALRERLENLISIKGNLLHPEVLALSQKLDELLTKQQSERKSIFRLKE